MVLISKSGPYKRGKLPYKTFHHFNLLNLDVNIFKNEQKLSDTFPTIAPDVEIHWKLETKLNKNADFCCGKSNTVWKYVLFGNLFYYTLTSKYIDLS